MEIAKKKKKIRMEINVKLCHVEELFSEMTLLACVYQT